MVGGGASGSTFVRLKSSSRKLKKGWEAAASWMGNALGGVGGSGEKVLEGELEEEREEDAAPLDAARRSMLKKSSKAGWVGKLKLRGLSTSMAATGVRCSTRQTMSRGCRGLHA